MVKSEICGCSVCRNYVWPRKFPFGAFIFWGQSLPSLGSQCHSSLLLCVLDLYISMFVCPPLLSQVSLFILAPAPVQCWHTVKTQEILLSE